MIATAKHFVGYAASEGGLNWAPAHIAPRELREVYLYPFEAAVRSAGLRSVMNGYHELDGVPCTADQTLLTGILRDQWGFEGLVASDYFSIRQLIEYHQLAADASDAAAMALSAGLDVELPSTDCFGAPLLKALESGLVDGEAFEAAVRRVLRAKFELGLFEQPFVEVAEVVRVSDTPGSRDLARRIAGRSLVLLRNDGVLPLAAETGSVALIGPNAHEARHLFGDYTYPAHVEALEDMRRSGQNVFSIPFSDGASIAGAHASAETVLDALRQRLGARIRFAPGCEVDGTARDRFDEAVALAAEVDVAVMVMGDKAGLTGDCTSGEGRDRASLDLPGVQEELVRAVVATGTPVVLVLVCGRPGASAWVHEHCAAVLMAWLPGQEGAGAIADALTGRLNPGGKLPISYPRTSGQIPVFYGHKPSGGRSHWKGDYVDSPSSPLYPFGHGLSYTTFALSDAAVVRDQVSWNQSFGVEVTVTNTGEEAGGRGGAAVRAPAAREPHPARPGAEGLRPGRAGARRGQDGDLRGPRRSGRLPRSRPVLPGRARGPRGAGRLLLERPGGGWLRHDRARPVGAGAGEGLRRLGHHLVIVSCALLLITVFRQAMVSFAGYGGRRAPRARQESRRRAGRGAPPRGGRELVVRRCRAADHRPALRRS